MPITAAGDHKTTAPRRCRPLLKLRCAARRDDVHVAGQCRALSAAIDCTGRAQSDTLARVIHAVSVLAPAAADRKALAAQIQQRPAGFAHDGLAAACAGKGDGIDIAHIGIGRDIGVFHRADAITAVVEKRCEFRRGKRRRPVVPWDDRGDLALIRVDLALEIADVIAPDVQAVLARAAVA